MDETARISETQVRQRVYTAAAAVAGGLSYYSLAVARSLPTRVRWVSTLSGTMASAIGGRVYANTTETQPMILDDTPMERAFASPEANTFLREITASAVGGAATGVAATVARTLIAFVLGSHHV
ncbi:hypothetical protein, variant [Saprolegnia diclina VS20]|uniref:Uncharacterized protein n=1 Tax=Saprolegnia diclina (strain VS20) TaxID=1156394 RepID=T0Q5J6_SAPDV|nr:hypothetical protein, variant [Saprolegnia diclina VS20]EQC29871.1 hypothetical protein, variant [Saprolegnia diclina VS20]|eukprot:XP_008616710.1 hypothetical protein, variant [Saprolegnia diclina VS20]